MCIFDIFSQKIDAAICDYYGPAAGSLALMLSYRLVTSLSMYPTIFLSVIPIASISLLVMAALLVSRMPRQKTRMIDALIDESDVIKVRVDLDSYVYFARVAAGLIFE
ncbi:hypothetical protein LPJ64_005346 [Coemansia asiatica]|uniref:Uncharacterized protein n=1 Tax=Coemansia asiatica TaxID=1052880 RepID=A0A9W7XHC5_9FUNG|nr:hypothetical protein LPJ64_005346 [Coemansia asiatica]